MSRDKRNPWVEMNSKRKTCVIVAAVVQITLAAWAWADLARRSKSQVRGRKAWWASIIGINFVGPLAYFALGRIKGDQLFQQVDL